MSTGTPRPSARAPRPSARARPGRAPSTHSAHESASVRPMRTPSRPFSLRRPLRAAAVLALGLALTGCDALPGSGGTAPSAAPSPMDPAQVEQAATTAVDPAWLCGTGGRDDPVPVRDRGTFTPESVSAEGNDVLITGAFQLDDPGTYTGFFPDALVLPAQPGQRGTVAEPYDMDLADPGAPAPPIVVRARVEVPSDGPPPIRATAKLTLGTCDDAPLPDGQYVLLLRGDGGQGRAARDSGWAAPAPVLIDVAGGKVRPVPGVVTAPEDEGRIDPSGLRCGARLEPVGDGAGVTLELGDRTESISTVATEEDTAPAVTASLTFSTQEPGTRALLPAVVLTDPDTGRIVAGARNAELAPLHWVSAEGTTLPELAWVGHETCSGYALSPGTYTAHGAALTRDAEGTTHLILSTPWDVTVTDEEPDGQE